MCDAGLFMAGYSRVLAKHPNCIIKNQFVNVMHMTCWVGTARTLVGLKKLWQGTLVFIAQPAEEIGGGARRMIADGLFKRFPRPDYCLGLHCDGRHAHGHISYSEGLMLA